MPDRHHIKPPIVWIVDDDPLVHFITKKMMKDMVPAEQIISFFDGRQIYNFINDNINNTQVLADFILLDINMPNMDGLQFLDAYTTLKQQISKEITIYVISSSMNRMDLFKAKNSPYVRGFVSKPLDKKKLSTILGHL